MALPKIFPAGCSKGPLYRTGWDAISIMGKQLPGRVEIHMKIKVKKDPRKAKAPGKHGGAPTVNGLDPQSGTITLQVWTNEQLEKAEEILGEIVPYVGYSPSAYTIDAPQLRTIKVKAIIVTGASEWHWATMPGGGKCLEMVIDFDHWVNDQNPKSVTESIKKKKRKLPPTVREGSTDNTNATAPSLQPESISVTEPE